MSALTHIYADIVDDSLISDDTAMDLLQLSAKLCLPRLTNHCELYISRRLDLSTVLTVLQYCEG